MPTLQSILVLLVVAVLVVVVCRRLRLPALVGYLLVGVLIGPHALGWIADTDEVRHLAEFGVVFLMFSIGLEFSLPKLVTMRRIVFGLGAAQVVVTVAAVTLASALAGPGWKAGFVLGGVLAMSSTAIVSKMIADRLELNTVHGRQVIGVLLFQDLAVVPMLILAPALSRPDEALAAAVGLALLKAAVVLVVLLSVGQGVMRRWFHVVAAQKSSELFVLNVLLMTLGLAFLTQLAGLSLALGAFVAGMLISETEYRYQVEDDIKPFRDVLLGLFFVTIGMLLDPHEVAAGWHWVLAVLAVLIVAKALLITGLARAFGSDAGGALRTGLDLAHAGEFGFVLLAIAAGTGLLPPPVAQPVLAAMVISMLIAPFIIDYSEQLVRHWSGADWMSRAMELHQIAVQSMRAEQPVLICGFGRSGQNLARLLARESIDYIALDVDPGRVREAAAAGETVVFGDASRREVLMAAGLPRARALVVTFADTQTALRILSAAHAVRPDLPVIVRTVDDSDLDRLREAGAAEVVAEIMEGSLMLATHAMMLLGVPLNRVLRRIREAREARYSLFRGFFHGLSDAEADDRPHPRLHSVHVTEGAHAIGRTLAELGLDGLGVEVNAVRRRNIRAVSPEAGTRVEAGDVLVLLGHDEALAAAEIRLLQG